MKTCTPLFRLITLFILLIYFSNAHSMGWDDGLKENKLSKTGLRYSYLSDSLSRHAIRINLLDIFLPQAVLRYEFSINSITQVGIGLGYQFRNNYFSGIIEPNHIFIIGAYETPVVKLSFRKYIKEEFPGVRSFSIELTYKDVSFDPHSFPETCRDGHEGHSYSTEISNHSNHFGAIMSFSRQLYSRQTFFIDFSWGIGIAYEDGYYTVKNAPDPYALCSPVSPEGSFKRERWIPEFHLGLIFEKAFVKKGN